MNTQKYVTLAHNEIYKNKSNRGCKSEYSIEHKINKIFYVCSNLRTWSALDPDCIHKERTRNVIHKYIKSKDGTTVKVVKTFKPLSKSAKKRQRRKRKDMLDPDTYRKIFNKWSDDGIFELAYKLFYEDVRKKLKLNENEFFIDSTNIQNMNGNTEEANMAAKIKSKLSIKITAVINQNKLPVSFVVGKGSAHDSKFTIEAMERTIVPITFSPEKKTYLVGDPAYTSKEKAKELAKRGTKLLVKPKKNAIEVPVFTKKEEKIMKKRAYIEHFFPDVKRNYIQVAMKFASKLHNYMSFLYLASLNAANNCFIKDRKL